MSLNIDVVLEGEFWYNARRYGNERSSKMNTDSTLKIWFGVGHYLIGKQGYGNVRGIWQTVYLEAQG